MSQKSKGKRARRSGVGSPRKERARQNTNRSRPRVWLYRLILVFVAPVLAMFGIEFGLRQFDYGYSTDFFIASKDGKQWVENPKFAWQFYSPNSRLKPHPFSINQTKAGDTIRVFVLGESAALGTPESAYGFVRILDRMLSLSFPDKKFEIVNAAMPGINSHLIRSIAQDCSELDPDLMVVYMGNNEMVGLHSPGPESRGLTEHLTLLHTIQWVRSSRIGQLLGPLAGFLAPKQPSGAQDMDFFRAHRLAADDVGRLAVYDNFRSNLGDILDDAKAAGAKTLLSTVAVNVRECPPLGSLHDWSLSPADLESWEKHFRSGIELQESGEMESALEAFRKANELDPTYAELVFRMAMCLESQGEFAAAKEAYLRAKDLDALPFRADSSLNTIIREEAQSRVGEGFGLVEADQSLGRDWESGGRLAGLDTFYEHVHFRFSGDYELAALFFERIQDLLRTKLELDEIDSLEAPSLETCAAALAYNRVNEGLLESSIMDMTAQAPFLDQIDHEARKLAMQEKLKERYGGLNTRDVSEAFRVYQAAMDQYPNDWNLFYLLARLHFTFHNFEAARENLKRAVELMPHVLEVRLGYTRALIETKQFDQAFREIDVLQEMAPDSAEVAAALGSAKARQASNR